MNKQRAIFILFPVFSLFLMLQSCTNDDEPGTIHGSVEDFYLSVLDNSGDQPALPGNNNFPKDALLIAIQVKIDAKSWEEVSGRVAVELRDPISALRIFTLNDFNDAHPAGSEITDLFKQYPLKLQSNLDDQTGKGKDIAYLAYHDGFFYKALLTPPDVGTHQFKIEMEFKSGELISHDTPTFDIY